MCRINRLMYSECEGFEGEKNQRESGAGSMEWEIVEELGWWGKYDHNILYEILK